MAMGGAVILGTMKGFNNDRRQADVVPPHRRALAQPLKL
jgi:hypothetical protein